MTEVTRTLILRALGNGKVEAELHAPRHHGESNVPELGTLVIHMLNQMGERWQLPVQTSGCEPGVDFTADGVNGERQHFQVVRVPVDHEYWHQLVKSGCATIEGDDEHFALLLIEAIRKKRSRYSPGVRRSVMLVLDGQYCTAFALKSVLKAFSDLHLKEAQSSGFDDIFLLSSDRFSNLLRPHLAGVVADGA